MLWKKSENIKDIRKTQRITRKRIIIKIGECARTKKKEMRCKDQ